MSSNVLKEVLQNFGIIAEIKDFFDGPFSEIYEVQIDVSKLCLLEKVSRELALAMKAYDEPIITPIYSKGLVSIEFPKSQRKTVELLDLCDKQQTVKEYQLPVILGCDSFGRNLIFDLIDAPHILVAGTTGSGKSVCLKTIINSLLYYRSVNRFILIDPKIVEFSIYSELENLAMPIISSQYRAEDVLSSLVKTLDKRLRLFSRYNVYNIQQYISAGHYMDYIVVVIDELADLILMNENFETLLCQLAQKSRAVGIHFIVATQRPSHDIVTGLIKANFPMRIAFKTSSQVDSRIILDTVGAEKLVGKGDMLVKFSNKTDIVHGQCAYISDVDSTVLINRVNNIWRKVKNEVQYAV